MGNEWPLVKIEDIQAQKKGAIAIGPFGSRMKSDCYVSIGIPVIRGTNIDSGSIFKGNFVYISKEKADSLGSCNVFKNDLVFPHRGSIGEVGIVEGDAKYVISSSLMKLTVDEKKVNPKFLYYFFKSEIGKHELLKNASQVGTPGIGQPLTSLKSIEYRNPPIAIQNKIEEIISSLDSKIQLNRETNQTLEAMAQALFKSWFVDFDPVFDNIIAHNLAHNNAPLHNIPEPLLPHAQRRLNVHNECSGQNNAQEFHHLFPQAFEQSDEPSVGIQGWVPKGWGVNSVESLVSRLKSGKRYSKKDVLPYGQTPVFEQGQSILLGYHNDEANFLASIEDPVFIFGDHTCVTKLGVVPFSISANVIPLKGLIRNTYWTYFAVKDLQEFEEYRRHWMEFAIRPVVTPTVAVADLFADIICPLQQKSNDLETSSNYLGRLRDTLLPKLISGELRIPDAEQATEALAK